MTRLERIPFRPYGVEAEPSLPEGLLLYNLDARKTTTKPRFYVLKREEVDRFVPPGAKETMLVVQIERVVMSLSHVIDPNQGPFTGIPKSSYSICTIESVA